MALLSGRRMLIAACVGIFIWEVVISFAKYSYSRVGLTFKNVMVEEEQFPSLSLCPVLDVRPNHDQISFREYHESVVDPAKFLNAAWQTHYGNTTDIHPHSLRERSKADPGFAADVEWEVNVGYNSCSYGIPACLTFTPKKKFRKGLHSLLVLEIDTRNTNNVLLFMHEPKRAFVVEDIFGMNVLQLPKVPATSTEPTTIKMIKITPTNHEKLSKSNLPCSDDAETKDLLLPCLEDHIESKLNCSLPWRKDRPRSQEEEDPKRRPCSTVEDMNLFRELSLELSFANEETIYKLTGCYYSCDYTSYSSKVTFENKFSDDPNVAESNYSVQTWIHLSPTGTEVRTEIVVYDFYSLIGDIGGVMGLLLGTSFLSLYDIAGNFFRTEAKKYTIPTITRQ